MEQHIEVFKQEAFELLDTLVQSMLELEDNPDDMTLVDKAFRSLHTIKGSGGMFGFDDISEFVHDIETLFDRIRSGKIGITKKIIDLTLSASDVIKAMVSPDPDTPLDMDLKNSLLEEFQTIIELSKDEKPPSAEPEPASTVPSYEKASPRSTYRIRFKPNHEMFLSGTNPLLLLRELQELGICSIVCQTDIIPSLHDINPELCYIYWDIVLTTDKGVDAIKDVFIFVEDESDISIEEVDTGEIEEEEDYKRLGEILLERGDLQPDDIAASIGKQRKVGEILVENGRAKPGIVASALAEQAHVRRVRKQQEEAAMSIRVAAEKLDKLVNLVGELVTVQARLSQAAGTVADTDISLISEEVERLTSELRDNAMSIRMMPIGVSFNRFKRVVRDLSTELGKEVDFVTEGAETELDKTVIEKMNDPLTHLIRNCLDHGIESPEERVQKGKQAKGMIKLSARQSGGEVLITVEDDGAGLDRDSIRDKAVSKALISEDAELSDRQIYELIFAPGFSTASKVTNISGRGVGMDVVKRNIENLRGEIDIESSSERGTSITLKLPLTLAIIDGLLTQTGDTFFVLPLDIVEECIELTEKGRRDSHGRQIIHVRGEIVPYVHLRELFNIKGDSPSIELIVICMVDRRRVGFVVDSVIGEHQTVIKSLGRMYRDVQGVSGATILGDGTVALIADPVKLAQISS